EITPADVFFNRRALLAGALATSASALLPAAEIPQPTATRLNYTRNPRYAVNEPPNKYEEITGYNNFYEFGTDKEDPKQNARSLKPSPWNVTVDGEAEVKGKYTL